MTGRDTKKLTLRTDLFVTLIFREACSCRNCKCLNDCHERARSFECGRQQSAQKAPFSPRLHLRIGWRLRHLTGRHPIVVGMGCISHSAHFSLEATIRGNDKTSPIKFYDKIFYRFSINSTVFRRGGVRLQKRLRTEQSNEHKIVGRTFD